MPNPSKGQTKEQFVSEFMSSEEAKKSFPDEKQRLAVAYSKWREHSKQHKECIFSSVYGFESKETDAEYIKSGFIATTHLDSGWFDSERNVYVRDKIEKSTLDKWADEINSGNPRANKVSVHHVREPVVAGVGVKGSAKVQQLADGEFGLYVDNLIDRTGPQFSDIKYRVDNGLIDSFSIEFRSKDPMTDEPIAGAVKEEVTNGGIIRHLLPSTELDGWTLASRPMNENAVMIKEIQVLSNDVENKEAKIMADEIKAPVVEQKTPVVDAKIEVKEEIKPEIKVEVKEEIKPEVKEEKIFQEVKEALKQVKIEEKVKMNTNETIETKELREYKEVLSNSKNSVSKQFNAATRYAESLGLDFFAPAKKSAESRLYNGEFKSFGTNGAKLEFKSLGVATNTTTYTQSPAELSDVYDPVIYNTLNEATVFWNIVQKDDYSSKGNNYVQFTVKDGANTTAGAYTGNAVVTAQTSREKHMTKFKKYMVGVEVDGDMIAAARGGPIGDVFAREVMDSTEDLLSVINAALFAEVGLETAAGVIGLAYLSDAAGNTTLYGLTRSSFGDMDGNGGATYINASSADISLGLLRQAMRQSIVDAGSQPSDLVFVCDYTQLHKFLSIYDGLQRLVPTSTRFGFEGRPEIDGIPIFADKDCKSASWFLVDLKMGYRVAMWVPPTLEMLGKDGDSVKGFIKTYFATYSRNVNSVVEIYGCATA